MTRILLVLVLLAALFAVVVIDPEAIIGAGSWSHLR